MSGRQARVGIEPIEGGEGLSQTPGRVRVVSCSKEGDLTFDPGSSSGRHVIAPIGAAVAGHRVFVTGFMYGVTRQESTARRY